MTTVLRSPKGKLIEGTEHDGIWTPTAGLGLEYKIAVLLDNGWTRPDQ